VEVCDSLGNFLAYGYFNKRSQIQVRLLEWDKDKRIDKEWWREKIKRALGYRKEVLGNPRSAGRLINAEGDFLPGLIVDKYSEYLVLQSLTAGIERVKELIVETLVELIRPLGVYERSDVDVRRLEGLELVSGRLYGQEPPDLIEIEEGGLKFLVDIKKGQKTGFYLDQRVNREKIIKYVKGKDVLDCFSYTGAFSVYAGKYGAKSITCIESNANLKSLIEENIKLNGIDTKLEILGGDAFKLLRKLRNKGRKFDLIILDPPKFAKRKTHLKNAIRAYKDINMQAMKLLNSDGILVSFSCSALVNYDLFKKIIFWASLDAKREIQILERLFQAPDHPIRSSYPEGEYLKGVICKVY
jgi:23S rRNA (cytosine1962-C5)-methyltransferase